MAKQSSHGLTVDIIWPDDMEWIDEIAEMAQNRYIENWDELYAAYMESSAWQEIRAQVIEREGNLCQICGEWGNICHHLTYDSVFDESLHHLQLLCEACHDASHAKNGMIFCVRCGQRGVHSHTPTCASCWDEVTKDIDISTLPTPKAKEMTAIELPEGLKEEHRTIHEEQVTETEKEIRFAHQELVLSELTAIRKGIEKLVELWE